MMRLKAVALALVLGTALAAGAAAAARNPTAAQKAALVAALRGEQGQVAIQSISVSTAAPGYASMTWGYKTATNNSLFQLAGGQWKVIWTREAESPADGACAFVPAQVAHDLLKVTCPSDAALHARAATPAEAGLLAASFRSSTITPYAKTALSLGHLCISRLSPAWAAGIAKFTGTSGVVWFKHGTKWQVYGETLLGRGAVPPHAIVLSLASCTGYNPSDY